MLLGVYDLLIHVIPTALGACDAALPQFRSA